MKMKFLETYEEAIYKNIFIAMKLKINEGNMSQAIRMSDIPLSKKKYTALHQFPMVEDSTFILIRMNRIVL